MTNAQMIRQSRGRRIAARRWRECDRLRGLVLAAIAANDDLNVGRLARDLAFEAGLAQWTEAKAWGRRVQPALSARWPDMTDFTRPQGTVRYVD